MYEVFINDKSILITNKLIQKDENVAHYIDGFNWNDVIKKMNTIDNDNYIIFCENIDDAWIDFCSNFTLIQSAGGVVLRDQKILFIFRNQKWDLPKGKLENNEDIRDCALREVEEECGIDGLSITSKLKITYHIYKLESELILKETHWYMMKTKSDKKLIPQTEEGISWVGWKEMDQLDDVFNNTFTSIKSLLGFVIK